MKTLFAQMQEAIEEAVSESGRICEIIAATKRSGYDLCLALDSTVTISPIQDRQHDVTPKPPIESLGGLKLTTTDWKFLKELNISLS